MSRNVRQQMRQRRRIAEKTDVRISGLRVFINKPAFPRFRSQRFLNLERRRARHVRRRFMKLMPGQPVAAPPKQAILRQRDVHIAETLQTRRQMRFARKQADHRRPFDRFRQVHEPAAFGVNTAAALRMRPD